MYDIDNDEIDDIIVKYRIPGLGTGRGYRGYAIFKYNNRKFTFIKNYPYKVFGQEYEGQDEEYIMYIEKISNKNNIRFYTNK